MNNLETIFLVVCIGSNGEGELELKKTPSIHYYGVYPNLLSLIIHKKLYLF